MFNLNRIVLLFIGICVAIHIFRTSIISPITDLGVVYRFAFIPLRWTGGEPFDLYWFTSSFTYSFLHGDFIHLLVNMVWLAAFGSPLANRLGALQFSLFWLVTAVAASLFFFVFHSNEFVTLVGASGSISAMMAAAARFGFTTRGEGRFRRFVGRPLPVTAMITNRTVLAFVGIWFAINLLSGYGVFAPDGGSRIAWEAHIAGFVAGFFLISWFRENDISNEKP